MRRGAESALGRLRLHLRLASSTNDLARTLAARGAPHGSLVSADEQTSGRGRHGRRWSAPARSALLMSLILREWPPMLPLAAPLAVCDAVEQVLGERGAGASAGAGTGARTGAGASADARTGAGASAGGASLGALSELLVKWPNDVVVRNEGGAPLRKLSGILIEGRPTEGWLVVGIGLNVAVDPRGLPEELRGTAASMGLQPHAIESVLSELLRCLERRLCETSEQTLASWRERDALKGSVVSWSGGSGVAKGVDDGGRLLVEGEDGAVVALDSGEVVLGQGVR